MDRAVSSWGCFCLESHIVRDCLKFNYMVRVITVWAICQFVVKKKNCTLLCKSVHASIPALMRSHDVVL